MWNILLPVTKEKLRRTKRAAQMSHSPKTHWEKLQCLKVRAWDMDARNEFDDAERDELERMIPDVTDTDGISHSFPCLTGLVYSARTVDRPCTIFDSFFKSIIRVRGRQLVSLHFPSFVRIKKEELSKWKFPSLQEICVTVQNANVLRHIKKQKGKDSPKLQRIHLKMLTNLRTMDKVHTQLLNIQNIFSLIFHECSGQRQIKLQCGFHPPSPTLWT